MVASAVPRQVLRLSPRRFWRRFGRLEHVGLEFKASALRLQETVAAMAMTEGGAILIGVTDGRALAGARLDQATLDRLALVAYETDVALEVDELHVGGTPVVLVRVPAVRDRLVTTSDGRLLRRVGASNQPLRGEALARFARARAA
jgi:ATP-dependent DNA helicase RecG